MLDSTMPKEINPRLEKATARKLPRSTKSALSSKEFLRPNLSVKRKMARLLAAQETKMMNSML